MRRVTAIAVLCLAAPSAVPAAEDRTAHVLRPVSSPPTASASAARFPDAQVAQETAAQTSLPRASSDRPDDVGGPQVHLVYVVAADGTDRQLDVDGTVAAAFWDAQDWLASRTGGLSLRLDTHLGLPDVSFLRSGQTRAAFVERNGTMFGRLSDELRTLGFVGPGSSKIYVAVYDDVVGNPSHDVRCAGGGGGLAIVSLPSCPDFGRYSYRDLVIVHEIVHAMGQVSTSAPHSDGGAHIAADRNDLMSAEAWVFDRDFQTILVDRDQDDYWNAILPWLTRNHHPVAIALSRGGAVEVGGDVQPYLGASPGIAAEPYCDGACERGFRQGARTTLTPLAADESWRFAGWTGGCAGASGCELVVDGPKAVTGTFTPVTHLRLSVRGPGAVRFASGTCRRACSYVLPANSRLTLFARPSRRSRFVRWRGRCGSEPRCALTLRHGRDVTLAAVFAKR
jgi:Divergent InlB B-repeat domain